MKTTAVTLPTNFQPLKEQLLDAAKQFAADAQPLSALLEAMVADVERAAAEPLEIFPVCHHSPSSALHIVQRLRERPPKVIYMEACEDMLAVVEHLQDCQLPVALQAFAGESEAFPKSWIPLSVVLPLTESSAEYQAIAYALRNPKKVELVFVDRAVDYVFQWMPQEEDALKANTPDKENLPSEEAGMHGTAIGLQLGDIEPTFEQFLAFLLRNANVRHFTEWWDQYVEQAIIGADYATYRQVMFLIGSLFRRLGRKDEDTKIDELRERYMWTRMKQHLAANKIDPKDALYICGAAHTASYVAEFGTSSDAMWEIPPRTNTVWLYGLIPSSFAAIEYQFGNPAGAVALAEKNWKKSLKAVKVKPFTLERASKKKKSAVKTESDITTVAADEEAESVVSDGQNIGSLLNFLTRPPVLSAADTEELLRWCADIVGLARQNGYLSSTADSIAIYETSMLLAHLRNRPHPSPYDFQDAAVTCLEKNYTPKRRNIQQLCQVLLGGNRIGTVGYTSLPPLVQNVYDRLQPLNVNLEAKTIQRALMDFKAQPDLLRCSDVLWRLNYLVGDGVIQPIMGERTLGHTPLQESWDVKIGQRQGAVIQLGYEGVTLEQVLEQRIRRSAFAADARASLALTTAEDSVLYLSSSRLTTELGEHAIHLLKNETSAEDAPQIFERVRRLVHYYRSTPTGLPDWIQRFVATGYSHYATLLPQAFADRGTSPEQIAGMLGFVFTLESLALAMGAHRSQLLIAMQQARQSADDPAKLGLLWTAEWLLNLRTIESIREFFNHVLTNPMMLPTFPDYLNGFILALNFTPRIGGFVVELLSRIFGDMPDNILMPYLPGLILRLRAYTNIVPTLMKEAAAIFPNALSDFEIWQAPWLAQKSVEQPQTAVAAVELSDSETMIRSALFAMPDATNAFARLLGVETLTWMADMPSSAATSAIVSLTEDESKIQQILHALPAVTAAMEVLIGDSK